MRRLKIYLDNCCYNRPYDDQSYINVSLETQAKLYIQNLIRGGEIEMVSSYILEYENSQNPFGNRRDSILDFLQNASEFVGIENIDSVTNPIDFVTKYELQIKKGVDYEHSNN